MLVCPFPTDPKFRKTWVAFFFFLIFNFAFLNKIFKIKVSKYIYCIGTEGIHVYPMHVSTRLFDVTYLNTETIYYICISLTSRFKNKKKKSTYRPSQFSGQKSKQILIYLFIFRPYRSSTMEKFVLTQ